MNTDLELTLKHLKALVACDTSNPPRKIEQSGLISIIVGAGAAWFGLYAGTDKNKGD